MSNIPQTEKGARLCAVATLAGIIGQIAKFDRKCKRAESTDTGEVWELLREIRKDARKALREFWRLDDAKGNR